MLDAYNILNINGEMLKGFYLLANRVVDNQIEKIINQNVSKLKNIEQRLLVDEGIKVTKQSIDEVLYKVVQESKDEIIRIDNWTMRELRIVSYYLMKLQDEATAFNHALNLLDKGWKNIFFNGIVFFLMNSWCLIRSELRQKTSQLVIKKLHEYSDNNRRYVLLKNHANMFEDGGPQRLAYLLASQNKDIREAPLILGCKPSSISQSYFSDVIVKYYEKSILDEDTLEGIFTIHDNKRTKQLVFANLVMKADEDGDQLKQTQLSKFINRVLGDVSLTATWAPFIGASETEARKLKDAMQRVNMWFTRRIIETFFEVCVQDKARKDFWLDYVSYVKGFKIVGSTTTKILLQNDPRIGSLLYRHFIETNSKYSQTAALVLSIKDYVLVEFSDTGSLYAYKQNHIKVQFIKRGVRYMTSTNDLKDTSVDNLVETNTWGSMYYNDEGRLTHRGFWQNRLRIWLNIKVLSANNIGISFFESRDDNTFTAQPLPKQDKIRKPVETEVNSFADNTRVASQIQTQSYQSGMTTQTSTKVVYEKGVHYYLSSKWFFNGICRIVCNSHSYYVNITRTEMFVRIKGLDGTPPSGNIWIKFSNQKGWNRIIHSPKSGQERSVGFIKLTAGLLLYKQDINQPSFMSINV